MASWRVLVAVVAVVILTVVTGVLAFREQIRSRTLGSAVQEAELLSSVVIDRSLTLTDITHGMHPVNRSDLKADVILLKRRGEVVDLSIWSMATRKLVYADEGQDGIVAPSPDVFERAQAGKPFIGEAPDDPGHGENLVVYHPYDANGDGVVDAVAEVVLPSASVEESLNRSTWLLYGGGLLVLVLAIAGILQVRRNQLRQDRAAVQDPLTGLGNRMLVRRVAPQILADATEAAPAALLLIDLDRFKAVNDTLGHHAGDELLAAVADVIQRESGPSSVAARLGGDEFAVLLPRVADRAAARAVPDRIRDAIRRPMTIAGSRVQVDASIGMAWAPADGTAAEDLLRSADMAMYRAKHSGAGVAEYAEVAVGKPPEPAATTVRELSRALADHQLELYYQPVRAADSTISSAEVLARWRHPEYGLLEASMFIPEVAHTSLMSTLTEWVLREAADRQSQWLARGLDVRVSVNLAARSLYGESVADLVRRLIEDRRLPPASLELEVSEAIMMIEPDRAIPAMLRLRDAGAGLCLDNFGAAYGAVSILADAPVQTVKIDQRFGGQVVESSLARTLVSGWVRAAHERGLCVIAQGVETPATGRCLIDLGCDGVQGYGVCRPMPAQDFTQWLTSASQNVGGEEQAYEAGHPPETSMTDA
ncbi:EAL domain-containing protein [Hamadaea sp. NPDC051192]|uniref:putative bifunctional diguanylate cyclase/phosphodiesterase n=1 Tax=Hamadaea sp. NPDC051192 TaxID=3154940 RepID=UPI0034279780